MHESLPDPIDQACAEEERFRLAAVSAAAAACRPEKHPDFDGESCIDCGLGVEPERLQMGRIRCTACQTALEKRNKLRGIR